VVNDKYYVRTGLIGFLGPVSHRIHSLISLRVDRLYSIGRYYRPGPLKENMSWRGPHCKLQLELGATASVFFKLLYSKLSWNITQ